MSVLRRSTVVLVLAFVMLAGGVAGGVASIPAPGAAIPSPAPVVHRIDAIPEQQDLPVGAAAQLDGSVALLAGVFGDAADYDAAHADALVEAAGLVCEGLTAAVPADEMVAGLVTHYALTGGEASTLVEVAADRYCSAG